MQGAWGTRVRRGLGSLLLVMFTVALVQGQAGSPIVAAAKAGDRAEVRRLIAARANVNAQGPDGSTALLWAAYNGDAEMVRALLAAGAKVDSVSRYNVTPLLQAARTGETPVIEALLAAGADANLTPDGVESPLMAAARTGKVDAIRVLLTKGAQINAVDGEQSESALMWAAAEGHIEAVNALMEAGANPNLRAKLTGMDRRHADHPTGGFTALMWAARNGHADVVKTLAQKGAELNATNGDNLTAMNIAIINDRFDMAKALLDLGADPNDNSLYFAVDMHDGTTDMRARDGGLLRWDFQNQLSSLDLVRLLLDKGADPNKAFQGAYHSTSMGTGENHNGTPFFRAAAASDVEALKILASRGGKIDYILPAAAGGRGGGNVGRTALMAAAAGGRGYAFGGGPGFGRVGPPPFREPGSRKPADAVQVLIDAGADVNAQGIDDGDTVLHQATRRNDVDVMRTLLKAGANADVYNWVGERPIEIAEDLYETSKNPNAPPDAATLAAMQAGGALPEKRDPKITLNIIREAMGFPVIP